MSARRWALSGLGVLCAVAAATAQRDAAPAWPHWRGPDRDGVSDESGWDARAEGRRLWSTRVGKGYSCVSIAAGRLYTMGHDQDAEEDTVFCLDAETGEELWKHTFPARTWALFHGGGTLSTPSVDGARVFASNREGRMFCLDAAGGEVLWARDLKEAHDLRLPKWGFAASPLVLDDMIVMNVGRVLALAKDGEPIWKTAKDYGDCYSTPAELTLDGRACLAVFSAAGLAILERASGRELALHPWKTPYDVNAATPVVMGERIFVSSGYNKGCAMLAATDDGLEALWQSRVMRNHMAGCVHYRGHLYGFDEATFKCIDLDGEVEWSKRGFGKGAFVIAGGKLLILDRRGDLVIAEATPEEYRELSRTEAVDGGRCWTTPVPCGGRVYCRNSRGHLVCLDYRRGAK